ncbi:putative pentatricopeptide repeat-containing protein, mitochondrial [Heracleum sosnowskyi]|uniref:Pentatricopeptide repeat-containing protein, mitochondrial n=1 Tax=Heracleum sosnowskyi TaxID=360622 RepID=A0AAD8N8H5_9APIA|nr:putative pentatricopeptide repeat-containing protein, mitochondrial [Heracleum sosnowskyi]
MNLDLDHYARSLQNIKTINSGKQLHLLFLKRGVLPSALTIANRVLQMYVKCSHLKDAHNLFDEMPQRNCFTWNTMIEGYLKSCNKDASLSFFHSMPDKNEFSWNLVITGLIKLGEVEVGRRLFDEMPSKNGVVLNSVIHGYVRSGCPKEAVKVFRDCKLCSDDSFVLATVIGACTDLLALGWGKQIHARIIVNNVEFDSVLGSALINMYGKCGGIDEASHVLSKLSDVDDVSVSALISGFASCGRMEDARRIFYGKTISSCVIIWNSMIAGYVSNNEALEALDLYAKMREFGIQEDFSTFASVLSACGSLGNLGYSKRVHGHACKFGVVNDLIVATGLVDMYAKCRCPSDACKLFSELQMYDTVLLNSMITIYSSCGRLEDAIRVFDTMPSKSIISWNSMLAGLSQNGCAIEALDLFCKMNKMDLKIDKFSLASVISACASISSLELGEQIFAKATVIGLESDQIISTTLVDFYCKCGFVQKGRDLFDQIIKSDEASWNSMLMGYATNGYGFEALALFTEMRCTGFVPTEITFTAVLSACDHCGLVEEGRKWFYAMKHEYGIEPGIEHFSCMVDLFSRAGCLEEAMKLIEQMPFKCDESMWASVLRGCVAHGDKILGKYIVKRLTELDPENSGAYVQLSGMFATSGEWESSAQVRKLMNDMKIRKNAGCSWMDG